MSGSVDPDETLIFVVRMWRETGASGDRHWRGRVEHVASQEVGYVEEVDGVARFIERWARSEEHGISVQDRV
ncbi:MAG: hypothetical protein JXM73_24600 [Anaerolineae bacterium]|nr:hypothetical protein [Anaerolineae bacterium]